MGRLKKFKGTQSEYKELHDWIRKRKLQPECCPQCKKTKYVIYEKMSTRRGRFIDRLDVELSNISGEYKRDVDDFQWLCRDCHDKYDRKNFIEKRCRYFVYGNCHYYRKKCIGKWHDCDIYKIMIEKNTPVTNVIPSETKT